MFRLMNPRDLFAMLVMFFIRGYHFKSWLMITSMRTCWFPPSLSCIRVIYKVLLLDSSILETWITVRLYGFNDINFANSTAAIHVGLLEVWCYPYFLFHWHVEKGVICDESDVRSRTIWHACHWWSLGIRGVRPLFLGDTREYFFCCWHSPLYNDLLVRHNRNSQSTCNWWYDL